MQCGCIEVLLRVNLKKCYKNNNNKYSRIPCDIYWNINIIAF